MPNYKSTQVFRNIYAGVLKFIFLISFVFVERYALMIGNHVIFITMN